MAQQINSGSCTSKHDTLYWWYAQKLDIRLSALLLLHQPGSDLLSAQQGNSHRPLTARALLPVTDQRQILPPLHVHAHIWVFTV
jgi:hypothetical protein